VTGWIRKLALTVLVGWIVALSGAVPGQALRSCRVLTPIYPGNQGVLSHVEAIALAGAAFDRINTDNDGSVDARELEGRMTATELANEDPDKDGTLDKGEYLAAVDTRFGAVNAKARNFLTCRELRSKAGEALLLLLKP
jgi:hypothetical protein